MERLIGKDFALGTYKRYHTTLSHVAEHLKEEYHVLDIPISNVNLNFIEGLEYLLKTAKACNHNSSLKYVNNFKKIVRFLF